MVWVWRNMAFWWLLEGAETSWRMLVGRGGSMFPVSNVLRHR